MKPSPSVLHLRDTFLSEELQVQYMLSASAVPLMMLAALLAGMGRRRLRWR